MVGVIKQRGSVLGPFYCLIVFTFVTALVTLIRQVGFPLGSVLIPTLWGLGAVLPLKAGEGDLLTLGLTGQRFIANFKYFMLVALVVFPLYSFAFQLYVKWGFSPPATSPFEGVSVPHWLLYNFLAVALFEELFFRGFVQGRFENYATVRFFKPGTVFWMPILVSSFLFALAHAAVYIDPEQLVVFFPALLFGWLRAKTGSLLAPILFHGTANVISLLLIRSAT